MILTEIGELSKKTAVKTRPVGQKRVLRPAPPRQSLKRLSTSPALCPPNANDWVNAADTS